MNRVTSKDGTRIAFEKDGRGRPLILVGGALSDRSAARGLVPLLAERFTVVAYDRRGRGDSGDTPPYAVGREVEDIAALVAEVGGTSFLYGHSSGAVLALEAACRLEGVSKLAVYEPPFIVDRDHPALPPDYEGHLERLLSEGRRGEAVEYFMTVAVNVPAGAMERTKQSPVWPRLEALAHTLLYDQAVMSGLMGGRPLPRGRWDGASMPVLVMAGGASPEWMQHSARALAALLPGAVHRTLPGQTHGVDPSILAPPLREFYDG